MVEKEGNRGVNRDSWNLMEASCDDNSSTGMLFHEEQFIPSQTNRKIEVCSFSDLNKSAALEISSKNKNKSVGGSGPIQPTLLSVMKSVNMIE